MSYDDWDRTKLESELAQRMEKLAEKTSELKVLQRGNEEIER